MYIFIHINILIYIYTLIFSIGYSLLVPSIVPSCILPVVRNQTQNQLLYTSFVEDRPVQEWLGPRCIKCLQGSVQSPIQFNRLDEILDNLFVLVQKQCLPLGKASLVLDSSMSNLQASIHDHVPQQGSPGICNRNTTINDSGLVSRSPVTSKAEVGVVGGVKQNSHDLGSDVVFACMETLQQTTHIIFILYTMYVMYN